jgi:hypothetical protein
LYLKDVLMQPKWLDCAEIKFARIGFRPRADGFPVRRRQRRPHRDQQLSAGGHGGVIGRSQTARGRRLTGRDKQEVQPSDDYNHRQATQH